jgi:muramoyltetrapeptide carboxypeptidase
MMDIIKPKRLCEGDTISVISASSDAASKFPHRLTRGVEQLERMGYKVKILPSTYKSELGSAGNAQERADDVMNAFCDSETKAIIASIGGLTQIEILNLLDYEEIRQNPKIFCGYSDNSILHGALYHKAKLVSFYGPGVLNQFAEYPKPLDYTLEYFLKAVSSTRPVGEVSPSSQWTDELLDWGRKQDLTRPRSLKSNNDGNHWLRKGSSTGRAYPVCLPTLITLLAKGCVPDLSHHVLMLDVPEGEVFSQGTPVPYINWYLATLKSVGIFDKISGLIFGRLFRNPEESLQGFYDVIENQTRGYDFPVMVNANFGHADPIATIPYGVEVKMCGSTGTFSISESGVR